MRMQTDLEEQMNLRVDQAVMIDLGSDETASREAASVLGPALPKQAMGVVVV